MSKHTASKLTSSKAKASSTAPFVVTRENFGDLLIQGAREAVTVARGKLTPARVRVVTVRDAAAAPPPVFTGPER